MPLLSLLVALGARAALADEPTPPAPTQTVDKEQIRATVRAHLDEVRACRDKVMLDENPNFAGRIDVRFRIDPPGTVGEATVTASTVGSKIAEACIVTAIKTWTFEKVSTPTVIAYPFVFKADDTPPMTDAEAAPFRRVVAEHKSEMHACYEPERAKAPTLAGRVKLRITISTAGTVTSADVVASTLNEKRVEKCLRNKIRAWQFPKVATSTDFMHVFDFR